MPDLLPTTHAEMRRLGWSELDVLLITGDAYIDHPSFGIALIGRWLVHHGFQVGIVAQPRWTSTEDLACMGRPRLCVGVTAGSLDSMLAHYTAFRKKRSEDAYTPGGLAGARPNRATLVYAGLARQAFPGTPVILGGIEASMRRATHYDFWSDKVRRSILLDAKAELLIYGMAEQALLEVCNRLRAASVIDGDAARATNPGLLRRIPGTAYVLSRRESSDIAQRGRIVSLPSHEEIEADPARLLEATLLLERQVHQGTATAVQLSGDRTVVFEQPAPPPSAEELDALYALPFTRNPHPAYKEPIPAVDMIRFSITAHRGCAGGCSFCSLALHQGRHIASRSADSIVPEARQLTQHPDWKGSITDVGGPSANMWRSTCRATGACTRESCLVPDVCPLFRPAQGELVDLLDTVASIAGVKHLRVASGVRHDLALRDPGYLKQLIAQYVGGQLKLAPEHCCDHVLRLMRKPDFGLFEQFLNDFERLSKAAGKEQYVVPYLISAFPGSTDADMHKLRAWLKKRGWRPQQVQCFIPLPGTVAAAVYYSGRGLNGEHIHVARTDAERLRQHHILLKS